MVADPGNLRIGDNIFLGRDDILVELDDWLLTHNSPLAVLSAGPGYGKTAVAKHWIERIPSDWNRGARVLVHSFRGQSETGDGATFDALASLCRRLLGHQAAQPVALVPERQVSAIVDFCRTHPTLFVLDGFETQQDPDGRIAFESLPMEELLLQLAELPHTKLLVTTRRRLTGAVEASRPRHIEVGPLRDEDVFDLLVQTRSDLSPEIANALVTRFFAGGGHPLTVVLMLSILDHPDKAIELLDLTAESPLSALLTQIYSRMTDAERLAVDVLSLAGQALTIDEVQAFVRQLMGSEGISVTPPRVALRDGDELDLHPLVRRTLADLVRTGNIEHFCRVQRVLADACQRAAADVSRPKALPLLWRAVQHQLQANDMSSALAIYGRAISNEPPPGDPQFGKVWRSVTQDFAYELESGGLALLLEHPFWKGPALPSALGAMHANLLMRRLWVDRALGRMNSADGLGQKLWRQKIGGNDPSETLGQICLTTMICGRILRDEPALTATNPRYAGYWSTCAVAKASELPENRRGFPLVRSLVYRGAYLHRTDCPADARQAFEEAMKLQAELHRSAPEQPPMLIGVNAYLYLWFLIDVGSLADASSLVQDALEYLDELKRDPSAKLAQREFQWRLMTKVAAVWVAQEQALLEAHEGRAATAKRHYDKGLRLLLEIDGDVENRRDAIAYDLRSTFVRARLRQHAMEGRPELAERELKRSVENYARAGARGFAADCQTDLLRLYSSHSSFSGSSWGRPSNSAQRAAAVRLDDLAKHYPLAQKQWFRSVPLRTFR